MEKTTAKDLRRRLGTLGLKTTGNKATLLSRLQNAEKQSGSETNRDENREENEISERSEINEECNGVDGKDSGGELNVSDLEVMEKKIQLMKMERDLLLSENALLEAKARNKDKEITIQRFTVTEVSVMIPYFDPKDISGLSAEKWIDRLEILKNAYGWQDEILLLAACMKLRDAAKMWCDASVTAVSSWMLFKQNIKKEFPSKYNAADVHNELSRRKRL